MGACQGQFCGPRVREYMMAEYGIDSSEIAGPSCSPELIRTTLDKILEQEKSGHHSE